MKTIIQKLKPALVLAAALSSASSFASSHREAPLISEDPTADSTDLYAFRSPADPSKVTLVANYIPFMVPDVRFGALQDQRRQHR